MGLLGATGPGWESLRGKCRGGGEGKCKVHFTGEMSTGVMPGAIQQLSARVVITKRKMTKFTEYTERGGPLNLGNSRETRIIY